MLSLTLCLMLYHSCPEDTSHLVIAFVQSYQLNCVLSKACCFDPAEIQVQHIAGVRGRSRT